MNEYKQAFDELQEKDTFRGQQWFGERQRLVEKYAWAVPNEDALRYLAEFDELTEVGAGSGYWAKCINERGGNVRATDVNPPDDTWTDVAEKDALYLDLEDKAVLLVWPPYNELMSATVVRQRPNHIVYVGEGRGGCTATSEFFDIIEEEYGLVGKVDIPSYAGIHDNLFHYIHKL